jgi:hypothetical protein
VKTVRNAKGQMVVEAVLIMVVLLGIQLMVARYFKGNEVLKQLITGPWAAMAGMLQNGVWLPRERGAISHPSGHTRHITIQGEPAR